MVTNMTIKELKEMLSSYRDDEHVNVAIFNPSGDGLGDATIQNLARDDEAGVVSIQVELNQ